MQLQLDKFIDVIETRRKQLDAVVEACKLFKQRLDELPEDMALEAEKLLWNSLDKQDQNVPSDLAGRTALHCAEAILADHNNEPMHFSTIAKEAMKRGYKGRAEGDKDAIEATVTKSFWAAMSRSDDFEGVGKGMYKLKMTPHAPPQSVPISEGARRILFGDDDV